MISHGGRSVFRVGARCLGSRRTVVTFSNAERTLVLNSFRSSGNDEGHIRSRHLLPLLTRSYADKPVSRPKAHTGRTSATQKRAPTTSATKAAKKPAPKTTAPKKIPKVKSDAKPKPKPKPKAKKKATAKTRKRTKKPLTDKQKAAQTAKQKRERTKTLRETALLNKAPKQLPSTVWALIVSETFAEKSGKGSKRLADSAKELSVRYKNLLPEQVEHYNHLANQNVATNKAAYRQWVESYSPAEIRDANAARRALQKLRGKKRVRTPVPIRDERLVRGNKSAYIFFFKDRYDSGDFKGLKVAEAARLAAREWKGLSSTEKQPYLDSAAQDKQRKLEERQTVYNEKQ